MSSRLQSIECQGLAKTVVRLHAAEKSGVLNCMNRESFKSFSFTNGFVVAVQSNEPADFLGHRLMDKGRITRSQRDAALRMQVELGMKLGAVLLKNQVLGEAELGEELASQARAILQSVLTWQRGRFAFEEKTVGLPLHHPVWVDPRESVFSARLKHPQLDRLSPSAESRVCLLARGPWPQWTSNPEVTGLLKAARHEPTLRELAETSGMDWARLASLLDALECVGLIELQRLGADGTAQPLGADFQELLREADCHEQAGRAADAVQSLETAVRQGLPLRQILDRLGRLSQNFSSSSGVLTTSSSSG